MRETVKMLRFSATSIDMFKFLVIKKYNAIPNKTEYNNIMKDRRVIVLCLFYVEHNVNPKVFYSICNREKII